MGFWGDLSERRREEEWMDRPGVDAAELHRSLRYIRRINSLLLYNRSVIAHLERFSRGEGGWERGRRIEIVDLATGSADLPRAILRWARRRGLDVAVTGVELHEETARVAGAAINDEWAGGVERRSGERERIRRLPATATERRRGEERLRIVRGDALDPPFEWGSFDYAITALFAHHLDDEDVVKLLRTMDRLSRRGIIVADLLRHRRAYAWITLLTLGASEMVKHDARVSVAQAFTKEEVLSLRDRAGVDYARYYRHFGHRFVLAGQKT